MGKPYSVEPRVWGRIDRPGGSRTEWFATAGETERVLRLKLREMRRCDRTSAGYDETDYSAHGIRAGYLIQAVEDGVALPEAIRQSQHRPVQRESNYYNDAKQS